MERPGKILLVEDDQDFKEIIRDILELEGFETVVVADRDSALKAIEAEMPDLVLLDLSLPDGYSFDVCSRASRSQEGTRRPPVIVMSGLCSLEVKIKSFMSGAVKYFTKPFDVEDLLEAIRVNLAPNSVSPPAPA